MLYHVSDLLTSVCKYVNDLSIHYSNTTPKLLALQLWNVSLFNTRAKTNQIKIHDSESRGQEEAVTTE